MQAEQNYSALDALTRYCAAVVAAWCAETATYPLDLTKTRLQLQSEVASAKQGCKLQKKGLIGTARSIVEKEGFLSLWSGLTAMLQRHAVYSGCRLMLYEAYKDYMKDANGELSLASASMGGMLAGALGQYIASPMDFVKVIMQAEGLRVTQGKKRRFNTTSEAYSMIYEESGFCGFWRGSLPSMQRAAVVNMGDMSMYDYTKHYLKRNYGMDDGLVLHSLAAFVAGFMAAALGTPVDVLKTRLMNQPVDRDGEGLLYDGVFDCLTQTVQNEGFFALYIGFLPFWLRLCPWTLINWIIFEGIMSALGGKHF